jgi:predicted permease
MPLPLLRRLTYLWQQRQWATDLSEELEFHRTQKQLDLERRGMPTAEAETASRRSLGNRTLACEDARAVWAWAWLDGVCRDLVYARGNLRRHPTFFVTAVITLALGIGVANAVFSVLYAVVINPFASIDIDRLVNLRLLDQSGPRPIFIDTRQFIALRESKVLEDVVAMDIWSMTLTGQDLPEAVSTQYFSANGLTALRMRPLIGRIFVESDGPPGEEPQRVVVLTHRFWQRHFGGRADAIGQTLRLNRESYQVIGVLRPEHYPIGPDIIVPLHLTFDQGHAWAFSQARLKAGVDVKAAAAALQPVFEQFAKDTPLRFPRTFRVEVISMMDSRRAAPFVPTLRLVAAAAGLLLLLACANLSILLLARGAAREREFAIRAAIGASRTTLARQLFIECLLLVFVAGALGVLSAYVAVPVLLQWLPAGALPLVPSDAYVSVPALAFSVAAALASAVLFGLAPMVSFSRASPKAIIGIGTMRTGSIGSPRRTHAILLGIQVAVTLLVLAGTCAAVRALVGLYRTALGYDPTNVLAVTIDLSDGSYPRWEARQAFYERLRGLMQNVPDVQDVALMVYGGLPPRVGAATDLDVPAKNVQGLRPIVHRISAAYFSTMRIPVLRGRAWTSDEDARAAHVAVVSEAMAHRLWPDTDVVGQRIHLREFVRSTSQFVLAAPGADGWFEIVGIAGDTPNRGLQEPTQPAVYVPDAMMLGDSVTVILRTARDPMALTRAIREAVQEADANQPVNRMRTAETVLAEAGWARERFVTLVLVGFGVFALVLAAVGLYSVVAYSVTGRNKEFGIRRALGASRVQTMLLACGSAMRPIAAGLVGGGIAIAAANRLVAQWSIGDLSDPVVIVAASLVFFIVVAGAALIPAIRASRVDPMVALRCE